MIIRYMIYQQQDGHTRNISFRIKYYVMSSCPNSGGFFCLFTICCTGFVLYWECMKVLIKSVCLISFVLAYSCAPAGLSPLERAEALVRDMQTENVQLGHHFNTAAQMSHDVYNREWVLELLIGFVPASVTDIEARTADKGANQIEIEFTTDGWLSKVTYVFSMEFELYSAFSNDYKIRRIEMSGTAGVLFE